ncbi:MULTISPECIES: hypothetical protein [unclassified Streptomyces]|uniref:hypothetical protein n=1 Tax=unclassified Streptomyces TaxID=2593676 RepID=UPI0036E3590F
MSIGFGVDAYHGVSHGLVPENIAALGRDGSFLGAFAVPRTTREGTLFADAAAHARDHAPDHPGIVNGSIATVVQGAFGDVQFTSRPRGGELFVNPLMTLRFAFEPDSVAHNCLCLDRIEHTHLMRQVTAVPSSPSARRSGRDHRASFRAEPPERQWPDSVVDCQRGWIPRHLRT